MLSLSRSDSLAITNFTCSCFVNSDMRRVILRGLHAYELTNLILDHVVFKALFAVIANENYFMTATVV